MPGQAFWTRRATALKAAALAALLLLPFGLHGLAESGPWAWAGLGLLALAMAVALRVG